MTRGRKAQARPIDPVAQDQARLPAGMYWDKSGNGRCCRLRGIEVTDLTDADVLEESLRCRRRKGNLANITAWTPELRAAVAELTCTA